MKRNDMDAEVALPSRAQSLALEARTLIEAWHRLCDERGLSEEGCLNAVRHEGGDVAVARVRRQAAETLQAIQEKVEREVMHRPSVTPLSRKIARRGGI